MSGDTLSRVTLVLAVAESLRMRKPKAFVRLYGVPLIEHVVNRLLPVFGTVYLVGRDIRELS